MNTKMDQFPAINPNPVLSVEKDGTIIYSNAAGEPLLQEWCVKVGEKMPSGILDLVQRVISRNSPEKMEIKVGKKVYLATFHPIPEEKCVNVYGFDISEQKELEEKLRENEERYRAFFNTSAVGTAEIDLTGRLTKINERFCQITGYSHEELLRMNILELSYPDDRDNDSKKLVDYMNGRTPTLDIEKRYVRKDGRVIWVEVTAAIVRDTEGNPLRSMGVVQDITERKKAEEALNKAYENLEVKVKERTNELEEAQRMAHIGNWVWDIATDKAYWSDELYRIFGHSPHELAPSYDEYLSYVHPDDREDADNAHKEALNGKPFSMDHRIILASGEVHTIHMQAEVIFDDENIPIRLNGTVQDITERKKAEEKIKILAHVVESSNDAIMTGTLDGTITSWNKGAELLYGYSAEEVLGKSASIIEPDQLKGEIKYFNDKIKRGEKVKNYETLRLNKDGTLINVSVTLSPVLDDFGRTIALSVIVRDITERKRAEEKLRESEEKYRNIVETANEGIIIIDDETTIIYVNKKMVDMLGYTQEEDICRPIWDFISEEYKPIVKRNLEKRRRGISESYELKLICKDGSPLWTLINAKALSDKNGKFMGSLSMVTDITEHKKLMDQTHKRAEEITKIMNVAPVAIFIGHDPHGQRIYGNRMANELFETKVGENLSAYVTPVRRFFSKGRELTADELPMQQAALKNIDVYNVEFDVLLSSGKRRSLLGSASPLHDAGGHVRGSVGAFIDITERREAEEALKNFEIARKKEIHHRIKNNLQVVYSLLDLQAEQFSNRECIKDSEVMEAFRESQDRVTSMALIHEELYRGEETDRLDFSSYIKELADNLFLTYMVGNKDISLNLDLEEKSFFDIDTAIPLGIIINELVSNSFKYAFQGRDKGEIRIRLGREECNNTNFILTISDNGVGIPEDLDIENLDSLGMQLVTTLVEQLDGELELKRNGGTEFVIRFTVTEEDKQNSSSLTIN